MEFVLGFSKLVSYNNYPFEITFLDEIDYFLMFFDTCCAKFFHIP